MTFVSWTFESTANTFRGECKLRNVYMNVHPSFIPDFDHVQLTSRNGEVITIERDIRRITCKIKGKTNPKAQFEYQFAKPKRKSEVATLKRAAHAIAKQKLKGRTFDTPAEAAMASDQAMRLFAAALKKIAKQNPTFLAELNNEATGKLKQIHFPTVDEVQCHGEDFFKEENQASIHLKRNGRHMKAKSSCDKGGCNLGCLQASCAIKDLKRDLWVHSHTAEGPKTVVPHYCYETDLEQFLLNEMWLLIEIVKNENGKAERGEVVPFSIHGSSQHLTVLGEGSVCGTFGKWNLDSNRKQLTIQRQYRPVRADGTKKTTKWVPGNDTKKTTKCAVEKLVSLGADIESKDIKYETTALMYAAMFDQDSTVEKVVSLGADIESKNKYGKTALMYAAERAHDSTVEKLLALGADIDSRDKIGRTPLMYAGREGHESTVEKFVLFPKNAERLGFASDCGISEDEGVATDISICSDVQSVCSLNVKDIRSYNKEEVRDWVISTLGEKFGDECKKTAKRFFDNAIDGEDLSNFDESEWTEMAPVLGHRMVLKEQFEVERKQTSFVDQVFSCLPSTRKYAIYRSIFVSKGISSKDAARLIDKDLEEMGIQKLFHRKKILRKISEILNYSPRKLNSIPTSLSSVPSVPESVSSEIQFSGVRNAISTSPRGSVPDLEIPQNGVDSIIVVCEVCNLKISERGEACERACECSQTINPVIKRSVYGSEVIPVNQKPRRKCERERRSESQDERSRSYNSPSTVESISVTKFAEQYHKLRIDALPPLPHHDEVFETAETITLESTTDPKSKRNLKSRTQLHDQELRSRSYESVSTLEAPKNITSVSKEETREKALSSSLLSSVPEALEQPVNTNYPNVRQHEPYHRSRSYSEIDVHSIHLEDPAISDTPNVGCDIYQSMSLLSEETAAGELILVGKKLLDKSDFEAALICFFRARDIDRTRFEPYLFLGKISLQLGDYEDAIEHFTDAIELNAESVKAYCGRGQAYSKVDLVYEAFDDFAFARILDPESKKAIQGLLGLKDFLNPEYIKNSTPGHKFLSNDELKEAVDLWCSTDEIEKLIKYGHISFWDTSKITSMKELFMDKHEFDDDISDWDVSNVTDMSFMFANACGFNCDISAWDVSNVANMNCIFYGARSFDADVSAWD